MKKSNFSSANFIFYDLPLKTAQKGLQIQHAAVLTQFLPLLDTCEFLKTQNFPDQFFSNWYFWTLYNPLCPGKPLPLLFFDFTHFEK